jgi:hypothetical protein
VVRGSAYGSSGYLASKISAAWEALHSLTRLTLKFDTNLLYSLVPLVAINIAWTQTAAPHALSLTSTIIIAVVACSRQHRSPTHQAGLLVTRIDSDSNNDRHCCCKQRLKWCRIHYKRQEKEELLATSVRGCMWLPIPSLSHSFAHAIARCFRLNPRDKSGRPHFPQSNVQNDPLICHAISFHSIASHMLVPSPQTCSLGITLASQPSPFPQPLKPLKRGAS